MLHSQHGTELQFTGMHAYTSCTDGFMNLSELLMVHLLCPFNSSSLLPFCMFLMLSPSLFGITVFRYWTRWINWLVQHTADPEIIFVVFVKVLPMFNTLYTMSDVTSRNIGQTYL